MLLVANLCVLKIKSFGYISGNHEHSNAAGLERSFLRVSCFIIANMKKKTSRWFSFLFLLFLAALMLYNEWQQLLPGESYTEAKAEDVQTLLCTVVAVADGDTLTAQCGAGGQSERLRVRLMGIDSHGFTRGNL